MPFKHILIAILTVAVWGFNFVSIKLALHDIPPITLGFLRFFFTALPFVFFIPRPKVKWIALAGYGITIFALQFGFLFTGMRLGMSAGLSSMVLQVQVFFTIGLASIVFKERPGPLKIIGAVVAFAGVAMIGLHTSKEVNILGLLMLILGAFSWASGNIISKSLGPVNSFALVVWGGLVAFPFLGILAYFAEGADQLLFTNISAISSSTWWALVYIVYISTHVGFSLWSWLLERYSASNVAPFTLLVPVFGFLGSAIILKEEITDWKIHAGLLVITGLCMNIYDIRRRSIAAKKIELSRS
ncbi:MAG: EamA family transporter [Bdellovibrionota bacterium]